MMMKKKSKEQEEYKDETSNKSTENKQHSHNPENNSSNGQDNSVSGGTAGASGEASNGESPVSDRFVSEVKSTEEKLAEMQDKYIRLSAEFDNYRKRTLREKMELSKYAAEDIFLKILPIMDDFDRALSHMETATDCVAMKDGIDLIYNKFSEFLKQNGIKEIEAMNIGFDVELHDAVAKVPVPEEEKKGKVVDVVQKGYYIRDKVLRHSKVVVGE
jgi:molecular chaperone GrpE